MGVCYLTMSTVTLSAASYTVFQRYPGFYQQNNALLGRPKILGLTYTQQKGHMHKHTRGLSFHCFNTES